MTQTECRKAFLQTISHCQGEGAIVRAMPRRSALAALFHVALLTGCCCEGTSTQDLDAATPVASLDEAALIAFVPRFATASCNADARCGTRLTALRLGAVPEDCEAEMASTAPYLSWLGHPATFDAEAADACIAFLMQGSCIDLARARAWGDACRDVVRAPGEACPSTPPGAPAGASCASSLACGSGLRCDLATHACSAEPFRTGERCEPDVGCASRELVCVEIEGVFQCAAPRREGACRRGPSERSGQRGDCTRDHFCSERGVCVHLPEQGEACGAAHEEGITTCDEDLVCDGGRCVRARLLTQPCASNAACRSGRCEGGACVLREPEPCVR